MPVRALCAIAFAVTLAAQSPTARVSGRVLRSDTGEPLSKAIVSLFPQDQTSEPAGERAVRTGLDGAFVFSDLPLGSYAIEAERSGFVLDYSKSRSLHFTLAAAQNLTQLEIRMSPSAIVAGAVIDEDSEPVPGLVVVALKLGYLAGGMRQANQVANTTTDDRGNFRIAGLPPGSYFLETGGMIQHSMRFSPLKQSPERTLQYAETYYPQDALSESAQPMPVSPGTELTDIRIPVRPAAAFRITGKIVETRGMPIPTEVSYSLTRPILFNFGSMASIQPDQSFEIRGLAPGEYVLTASVFRDGVLLNAGYAKVHIVDANVRADIQMGSGAEVRGKVLSNLPNTAGLQVALGTYPGQPIYLSKIGADGDFDIQNIPPGQYWFNIITLGNESADVYLKTAQCPGLDPKTQQLTLDVAAQVSNCELTLANDAGIVTGQVTKDDKTPAKLIAVLIPQPADLRRIFRYTRTARFDPEGRFKIRGIIPEDYYLFAVPYSEDGAYFASNFADLHKNEAVSVSVEPNETHVLTAKIDVLR